MFEVIEFSSFQLRLSNPEHQLLIFEKFLNFTYLNNKALTFLKMKTSYI